MLAVLQCHRIMPAPCCDVTSDHGSVSCGSILRLRSFLKFLFDTCPAGVNPFLSGPRSHLNFDQIQLGIDEEWPTKLRKVRPAWKQMPPRKRLAVMVLEGNEARQSTNSQLCLHQERDGSFWRLDKAVGRAKIKRMVWKEDFWITCKEPLLLSTPSSKD